jgi:hypothetical protein
MLTTGAAAKKHKLSKRRQFFFICSVRLSKKFSQLYLVFQLIAIASGKEFHGGKRVAISQGED